MHATAQEILTPAERGFIDQLIAIRTGRPGAMLGILEAVQDRNPRKYLPLDTLRYVAIKTGTPLSRVYGVATFYALFNLEPQGENTICICRGTACHTRGSRNLLERLRLDLKFKGEANGDEVDSDKLQLTSLDHKFTVRTVACFGQCALAPVVEINHRICGHVNERTLHRELQMITRETE
jgi:NADH-quinone oxidoreductase subunit E